MLLSDNLFGEVPVLSVQDAASLHLAPFDMGLVLNHQMMLAACQGAWVLVLK